jgi:probable HAF family extracellular repeat protein
MSRALFAIPVLVLCSACQLADPPLEPTAPRFSTDLTASGYEAIDLGTLGGDTSAATAINDKGQVVGWSLTADGTAHGFLWDEGVIQDIGPVRFAGTQLAINKRGQVAGVFSSDFWPDSPSQLFVWQDGVRRNIRPRRDAAGVRVIGVSKDGDVLAQVRYDDFDAHAILFPSSGGEQDLGGLSTLHWTFPNAWNRHGTVVGTSFAREEVDDYVRHAFVWDNGVMTDLGVLGIWAPGCEVERACADAEAIAINDEGVVVGWSDDSSRLRRAVVWANGEVRDLGVYPGERTGAVAINEARQIAGHHGPPYGITRGFRWESGAAQDLGTLGGMQTSVSAMNDDGDIVGSSLTASGERHAFVWHNGQMYDLGLGPQGGDYSQALAINERGEIIGVSGSVQRPYGNLRVHRAILWRPMQDGSTVVQAAAQANRTQ